MHLLTKTIFIIMGMTVCLEIGSYSKIRDQIIEKGVPDNEMLDRILLKFGAKHDDTYTILNNEYDQEYNAYYNLAEFLDRYYEIEDSFDCYFRDMDEYYGNSVEDVAEELGIILPEPEEESE